MIRALLKIFEPRVMLYVWYFSMIQALSIVFEPRVMLYVWYFSMILALLIIFEPRVYALRMVFFDDPSSSKKFLNLV